MLKFRNRMDTPPTGFRWKDPLTGHEIGAHSYSNWISQAQAHRAANGLPMPDESEMEHQNCSRLPEAAARQFCEGPEIAQTIDGVSLTATDIARGTRTILSFKLAGSPLVSDEEANRRANICAVCPMNVQFRMPCSGICGELLEIVTAIVGGATTHKHADLHACAVCKCSLKAKVHIPLSILKKTEVEEHQEQFPMNCWQKVFNAS